jgi:hypothetical protein
MTATSDYAEKIAPFDQKTLAIWAADCADHIVSTSKVFTRETTDRDEPLRRLGRRHEARSR